MDELSIGDLEEALAKFRAGDQEVCVTVARKFVVSPTSHLIKLEAWKREQLIVESEWDAQAVGKALNIPLGTSIHKGILPAVEALKLSNTQLSEALQGLLGLGRKDTSNPKYDSLYTSAKAALNGGI